MNAGEIVTRFVADLSGFAGGISRATSMASSFSSTVGGHVRSVGSHFVNMGKSVLGGVESLGRFIFFGKQVASTAIGMVSGFLNQNAAMEQTRIAFVGLLGSGQAADTMLKNLQKFAASTPFEFPELAKDSQMLVGMGFSAQQVIPIMTAVGDAAAGVGGGAEGVESITRALGQMQAKGKISGEEMMQMTEAGIPAWKILADSMHLSVAQVQDLSQKGQLGSGAITQLWQGMEKMYGGQMAGQAQTFNGLLSTLKDNANMALMAFAGPLFNQAKGALSSLTTLAGSPAFANFAKLLGETVGGALAQVVRWIQQAIPFFTTLFTALQNGSGPVNAVAYTLGILRSILTQVSSIFEELGGSILASFLKNFSPLASDFSGFGSILNSTVAPALKTFSGILDSLDLTPIESGFNLLMSVGAQVVTVFLGLLPHVANLAAGVANLYNAIAPLVTSLINWLTQSGILNGVISTLGAVIGGVLDGLSTFASSLASVITWMQQGSVPAQILTGALIGIGIALLAIKIGGLIAAIPALVTGFIGWAVSAGAAAVATIAATWPILAIIAAVALLAAGIYLLVTNWGAVVKFLTGIWGSFVNWINQTLASIGQWFSDRWNEISTVTMSVWNSIVTFLQGLWNTIVQVVMTGIRIVVAVLTGGSSEAVIGVVSNWTQIRDTIVNIVNGIVGWIGARFNDFYNAVIAPLLPLVAWFNSLFTTIGQIILALVSIAVGFIQQKFNEAYAFIVSIWTTVSTFISSIWNTIYNAIASVVNTITGFLSAAWNLEMQGITTIWNAIAAFFSSIWNTIYNTIASVVNTIVGWLSAQWASISGTINSVWSAISSYISQIWNTIYNTISSAITRVVNWLSDQWNSIRNTVVSIWTGISTWLTTQWDTLVNNATNFVNRIRDGLTSGFNAIRDTVTSIWRGFINGIIDIINTGIKAVMGFVNGIVDGINNIAGALGVSARVDRINIPLIQPLASGTNYFAGGLAMVGEKGPELAYLPRGSQVLPADKTQQVVQQGITPHAVPGFQGGLGDLFGSVINWVTQGVGSIADSFLKQFNLNLTLPGAFGDIAGGILGKVKGWLGDGINSLITKAFGTAAFTGAIPTQIVGSFLLPPGGGFHAPVWYNASGLHQGMDFQFPQGSLLREVIGGMITASGWQPWGGEIDVRLINGLTERYLHLSALFAHVGQIVKRGDILGLTGGGTTASGLGYWSTGAHLHIQYDPGNYGLGINPLAIWSMFGLHAPFSFARGGVIREPVAGVGLRSGAGYSFGENGPETVTPGTGGRPVVFVLNIDGREFVRQVVGPNLQNEYQLYMKGGR